MQKMKQMYEQRLNLSSITLILISFAQNAILLS
jgi:hypothetical protein